jgi:hypothetical protein
MYTTQLHNNTDLPVIIETWLPVTETLNKLCRFNIAPYETSLLESITGEWFINTDKESIGKFRLMPCAQGDYAWMDKAQFQCVKSDGGFTLNYGTDAAFFLRCPKP